MDKNLHKRRCPNCNQPYRLKSLSTGQKENFPLFLKCGHVLCENCIRTFINCLEPIGCSICHQDMEIEATEVESVMKDNAQFYELFLINLVLVGELTVEDNQNIEGSEQDDEASYFLDLKSLLKELPDKCIECEQSTTTKCNQCASNLCAKCFEKTHMNFVIFKNHMLQDIESNLNTNDCKTHTGKPLNYYCKDCVEAICIDCLNVEGGKSCHNHNVVTMQEMNKNLLEEVIAITPNIKETFNRLTKTAVDIGALQYAIVNDPGHKTDLTKSLTDIGHYFSKLEAAVLRHKMDIEKVIRNWKCTVQQSLNAAKKDLADRIKEAHCLIKSIESFDDPDKLKQINLSLFLEQVKAVIDAPWYLTIEESNEDPFEITVKEELCDLVGGYIKLEDSAKRTYKLLSQSELGNVEIPPAPLAPVYPPELTKDIRQMNEPKKPVEIQQNRQRKPAFFKSAPKYKAKKYSMSSLDTIESDEESENDGRPKCIHPVAGLEESRQPFNEGSQELIYISHIVDPHDFYVQRACHQGLVEEMLSEFQNADTLPIPSLGRATSGKMYLAFNMANNKWQRCRVLDIIRGHLEKYLFRVLFIDFGSTATLSINELRRLPPARVHSPYPLAIHCSLASCVPSNGCWFAEDSLLIHKIVNNKQAVMYVHHIRSTSDAWLTLDVDLVTLEDGVSVAQALHFRGRARLLYPKLMVADFPLMAEKPKILVNHDDFKYKSVEDVFITHIQSPDHFFVRKRQCQDTYNRLCEDLIRDYGSSDNSELIYLPEKGMACVANIPAWLGIGEGAPWARALVLELPGRAHVRLALVDIGAEAVLHWTDLRRIHNEYTAFKALATKCYLSRVTTPLHKKWCPASVTMLQKYKNKLLQLHVEHTRKHNTLGVLLYYESESNTKVCINNEMIKHKLAVAFRLFRTNSDSVVEDQNSTTGARKKVQLNAKDEFLLRTEAKVVHCESPSLIYFTLAHQEREFYAMLEMLQMYYLNLKEEDAGDNIWEIGKRCCVFCKQLQTWRRATIMELSGDSAKVFYTDFALSENVPLESLKVLEAEFAEMGDAILKCHLSGVVPPAGPEWPLLAKDRFKQLLDAYRRLFITETGSVKDNSKPVEIWVQHIIHGGALEPDRVKWRCLNNIFIKEGLGLPMKPMPKEADDQDGISQNVVYVTDWLPPEPFASTEFTAMPTHVNDDGVIYLHDVTAQQATLEVIRMALDMRFKQPDPEAKYMSWVVGEPCIALFDQDKLFYRGRVKKVNKEEKSCLIHFIDYGNDDLCAFGDMIKIIVLHEIPVQAHRCVLDRIEPIQGKWDGEILDAIHSTVVEKTCYVKINGEQIDGVVPIELKHDGLHINDRLVEAGLAKYKHGSRAIAH